MISEIFLFIGAIFYLLGSLGIVRFPDLYTRLQASTKTIIIGVFGIIIAAIIKEGFSPISAKSLLIGLFLLFTAPTASHAMARAGYYSGVRMTELSIRDDYSSWVVEQKKEKFMKARVRGKWLGRKREKEVFALAHNHIEKTLSGIALLFDTCQDFTCENIASMEEEIDRIIEIEREADEIANQALFKIPRSVLLPEDRADLMELIFRTKKVAKSCETLVHRFEFAEPYMAMFPDNVKSGIVELSKKIIEVVETLKISIDELNKDLVKAEELSIKVSDLENEAEDLIRKRLFKTFLVEGKALDPTTFSIINEVIVKLDDIADRAEEVSDYIRIICVKYLHVL